MKRSCPPCWNYSGISSRPAGRRMIIFAPVSFRSFLSEDLAPEALLTSIG